jgi:predicted metal-dependent phosphoesterase TrpH
MIDLHAHTSCSDGSLTPSELVALAAETGLSAVAVTDHDSVEGVDEALAAGPRYGVEVVPGVEIPLEYERCTLDMLGYFLCGRPTDEFRKRLERLRRDRDDRNEQILTKLAELGYPLDPAELAEVADGEAVGRPHIGEALRRRGYVDSITEAFERFLRRGAPAFVDRRRLGLAEAVRLISSSGGVAVIAHPGIIRTDPAGLERLVREGVRLGVGGLECYYPLHDEETLHRCLALTKKYRLVATGGSDFHGTMKPKSRLGQAYDGRPVPDSVLAELKALCDQPEDGPPTKRQRQ